VQQSECDNSVRSRLSIHTVLLLYRQQFRRWFAITAPTSLSWLPGCFALAAVATVVNAWTATTAKVPGRARATSGHGSASARSSWWPCLPSALFWWAWQRYLSFISAIVRVVGPLRAIQPTRGGSRLPGDCRYRKRVWNGDSADRRRKTWSVGSAKRSVTLSNGYDVFTFLRVVESVVGSYPNVVCSLLRPPALVFPRRSHLYRVVSLGASRRFDSGGRGSGTANAHWLLFSCG
jgi:hypothetical protein